MKTSGNPATMSMWFAVGASIGAGAFQVLAAYGGEFWFWLGLVSATGLLTGIQWERTKVERAAYLSRLKAEHLIAPRDPEEAIRRGSLPIGRDANGHPIWELPEELDPIPWDNGASIHELEAVRRKRSKQPN